MSERTEAKRAAVDRMARRIRDSAAVSGTEITQQQARKDAIKIANRHDRKTNS